MFGFGKKDQNGRQTRIEHRGKHLRVSRTGGVAVRTQHKIGGVTVTANTKHGLRASTKIAPGLRVANQGGRFQLVGRWKQGPFRYNLSKRGGSVSIANKAGAFNFTNPNRSSFKGGGIQVRGKKAANLQIAYMGIMAVIALISIAIWLCSFPVMLAIDLVRRRKNPAPPEE